MFPRSFLHEGWTKWFCIPFSRLSGGCLSVFLSVSNMLKHALTRLSPKGPRSGVSATRRRSAHSWAPRLLLNSYRFFGQLCVLFRQSERFIISFTPFLRGFTQYSYFRSVLSALKRQSRAFYPQNTMVFCNKQYGFTYVSLYYLLQRTTISHHFFTPFPGRSAGSMLK